MNEKNYGTIGARLKLIRKHLNLNQTDMGALFNLSQSTYGSKEKDESAITQEMFSILYNEMNVNLNWFISGDGEMYRSTDVVKENIVEYSLTERVKELEEQMKEIRKEKERKE